MHKNSETYHRIESAHTSIVVEQMLESSETELHSSHDAGSDFYNWLKRILDSIRKK